jgi:hypothetical protein
MVIFAAATGIRPAEWLALERRDIDREARVAYVRRSCTKGRLKCTKTEASLRPVPLQAIALDAIEQQPSSPHSPLLFPAERGGYLDLHNFRNREWKPAQRAAGIEPIRRITISDTPSRPSALRAGISTFDLSRCMGASLKETRSPLTDSNRRPPPYHALRSGTSGNPWQRFGLLPRFRAFAICNRLPRVAPAGLHKGSIPCCPSWLRRVACRTSSCRTADVEIAAAKASGAS